MTQPAGSFGPQAPVNGSNLNGTTVSAQNNGLGGAVQNLLGGQTSVQGPSGSAYNNIYTNANNQGAGFFNQAAGYGQTAPTVNNQFQGQSQAQIAGTESSLNGVLGQYQNIINGPGPTVAQQQYQQAANTAMAQQQGLARSAQGGGMAQAGAGRAATEQAGTTQAQTAAGSQALRQQQIAQALQGEGQVYGQLGQLQAGQYGIEQSQALQNAQLQQTSQGQQNQQQLGLYGLGLGSYGQAQGALGGYTSAQNGAQGIATQANAGSQQLGGQLLGAGLGLAAGLLV